MSIRLQAHRAFDRGLAFVRAIKDNRGVDRKGHRFLDSLIDLAVEIRRKDDDVAIELELTADAEVPKERT